MRVLLGLAIGLLVVHGAVAAAGKEAAADTTSENRALSVLPTVLSVSRCSHSGVPQVLLELEISIHNESSEARILLQEPAIAGYRIALNEASGDANLWVRVFEPTGSYYLAAPPRTFGPIVPADLFVVLPPGETIRRLVRAPIAICQEFDHAQSGPCLQDGAQYVTSLWVSIWRQDFDYAQARDQWRHIGVLETQSLKTPSVGFRVPADRSDSTCER